MRYTFTFVVGQKGIHGTFLTCHCINGILILVGTSFTNGTPSRRVVLKACWTLLAITGLIVKQWICVIVGNKSPDQTTGAHISHYGRICRSILTSSASGTNDIGRGRSHNCTQFTTNAIGCGRLSRTVVVVVVCCFANWTTFALCFGFLILVFSHGTGFARSTR